MELNRAIRYDLRESVRMPPQVARLEKRRKRADDGRGTERTSRGNFASFFQILFCNTLENVEIMIFFLCLFLYIFYVFLGDFETRESWNYHWIFHRSDQYFLCSMEFLRIPNFFYLIFSFFSWKVLGAFKGFTWTHSRPRGESTPKDETIPERSGVRGDEASCDILAPSSKIVSFERIADERGYYSQGCERWIVEARDKRQWKVDTIMRLRYCEWFWDDIWVDRLRPPEWKYAIHSRIQNNAAAAAAAVCINNDKIYT